MDSETAQQTDKPYRRSRQHGDTSRFKRWRQRLRTSKSAKRRFINFLVILTTVLIAFLIGFYYFGPSFSGVE